MRWQWLSSSADWLFTDPVAPGKPEPVAESLDAWPTVLEQDPPHRENHVHWLDFDSGVQPGVVAIHPRGHLAALRTSCETVVYDLRSGKRLHAWLLPTTVVQFSGEGQRLLTQRKTEFTLWDLTRFQAIHRFEEPSASEDKDSAALRAATTGVRMPAALSPTGRLVAISNHRRLFAPGRPEALLVYSDRGALQHALTIPSEAEIQSVHFISERRLMMSQEWVEHNLRTSCHVIWDAAGGQKVLDLPPGETVRVSDDGRVVASARLTTTGQIPDRSQVPTGLRIWKVESGAAVQAVESPAPIRDFCLRPDGARVLAALGERLIEWDVASGARVWEVQKTEHPFATVVYSPDGNRRYATVEIPNGVDDDVDRHLRGWDVSTGRSLAIADYVVPSYNGTERLFFFPEGDRFVDLESTFVVRDIGTGKGLQTAPAYRAPQREAAIMPDGRKFLTGSWLSDAESGKQRQWSLPGADYRFIQAGRTLFSGDHMGVFLTHVPSGSTFWKYRLDSPYVPDVAASEDGERIVVAYRFGSQPSESRILVIDPRRPDQPWIIPESATAVAVTPDHTRFVAASHTAVSEWATDTQAGPTALWTPPGTVLFANYSRDGAKLLVGGTSGHMDPRELLDEDVPGWAVVLDVNTRQVVPLTGHTAPVTTGEFSPDGARCADRLAGPHDSVVERFDGHRPACVSRAPGTHQPHRL